MSTASMNHAGPDYTTDTLLERHFGLATGGEAFSLKGTPDGTAELTATETFTPEDVSSPPQADETRRIVAEGVCRALRHVYLANLQFERFTLLVHDSPNDAWLRGYARSHSGLSGWTVEEPSPPSCPEGNKELNEDSEEGELELDYSAMNALAQVDLPDEFEWDTAGTAERDYTQLFNIAYEVDAADEGE